MTFLGIGLLVVLTATAAARADDAWDSTLKALQQIKEQKAEPAPTDEGVEESEQSDGGAADGGAEEAPSDGGAEETPTPEESP